MDNQQAVVEWMDPDWHDHFTDIDSAYEWYQMNAFKEFIEAYREITGEEWDASV